MTNDNTNLRDERSSEKELQTESTDLQSEKDGGNTVAEYPEKLIATASPHIRRRENTTSVMFDVLVALTPAFVWGVFIFGLRSLVIGVISILSCVIFEYLFQRLMKRKNTIGDLSAAVTGLLLAMNLSSAVPYWIPVVGAFFAIVVVKGLFGGIGKNIVNPALAARIFLFAWPAQMNTFVAAGDRAGIVSKSADMIASATPLTQIKTGAVPDYSMFDLIIGNVGGCIGEVSALFLLIGGVYLLLRRVITWHAPVAYIATVALIAAVFPRVDGNIGTSVLTEIFSGGLIICAFFMATDYTTTPITGNGKLIFGVGCGIITMLIRYFGSFSEGASFSIMIMNLLVWYIDRLTMPKPFGGKANVKK